MCSQEKTSLPLQRKTFQPFFNLSIFSKFCIMFSAFFFGFVIISYHDYYFHHQFLEKLLLLQNDANQAKINDIVSYTEQHESYSFLMAGSIVGFLAFISFIAIKVLINLLGEMRQRLIAIRLTGESDFSLPLGSPG